MELDEMEYPCEMLYVAKQFYDEGRLDDLLEALGGNLLLYPDNCGILFEIAIDVVFEKTRIYQNEPKRSSAQDDFRQGTYVYVFWDELFYRYHRLCQQYEERKEITPQENPFVSEEDAAIQRGMQFNSWDYDFTWTTGPNPKQNKLILFMGEEFAPMYDVAGNLLGLRQFYREGVERLEKELSPRRKKKRLVKRAPEERKEAA